MAASMVEASPCSDASSTAAPVFFAAATDACAIWTCKAASCFCRRAISAFSCWAATEVFPPWLVALPGADPAVPGEAAGDVIDDEPDAPPDAFSEPPPADPTEAAEVVTTVVLFCTCIE